MLFILGIISNVIADDGLRKTKGQIRFFYSTHSKLLDTNIIWNFLQESSALQRAELPRYDGYG